MEKQWSPGASPAPGPTMLSLDLQVHGELGNKSKHGAFSKSHPESVSPPSYHVSSIYGDKNFSWSLIKCYGEKNYVSLGFRTKMPKKMFQTPAKKTNPSCSSTSFTDTHPKMGFCHFPPPTRPALLFPKGRTCIWHSHSSHCLCLGVVIPSQVDTWKRELVQMLNIALSVSTNLSSAGTTLSLLATHKSLLVLEVFPTVGGVSTGAWAGTSALLC